MDKDYIEEKMEWIEDKILRLEDQFIEAFELLEIIAQNTTE